MLKVRKQTLIPKTYTLNEIKKCEERKNGFEFVKSVSYYLKKK